MSHTSLQGDEPPPYSSLTNTTSTPSYPSRAPDPRSTSSTSLGTSGVVGDGKRNLLLVYLHGFMGSETSFNNFPAHVHNMISPVLADSHTVHTKVYPRYRSKKSIQSAANDLSAWLSPHESPTTDVILLGHSMGGILLAEVILLPASENSGLKHRILGSISFDTPFLGMHPGIIKSGLSSIFQPAPSPGAADDGSGQRTELLPTDPNFNPAFFNDNHLPVRTAWRNAAHFVNKHSNTLFSATKQMIASHMEFGGCLADYDGLKVRYCRLRMLEEEDAKRRKTVVQSELPPHRVRFANFYTASSGRPKKEKAAATDSTASPTVSVNDLNTDRSDQPAQPLHSEVLMSTPIKPEKNRAEVAEDSDDETEISDLSDLDPLDDADSNFDDSTSNAGHEVSSTAPSSTMPPKSQALVSVDPIVDAAPASFTYEDYQQQGQFAMPIRTHEPAGPENQLTDAALRAYAAEQAAMIPEPQPPGPPPSIDDFEDVQDYRNLLSEHGKACKAYFVEAKKHQKMQYERFVAESKQKMESYRDEIKKWNDMIVEESKYFAAGVTENARIISEIDKEAALSRAEHVKLVAGFRGKNSLGPAQSSVQAAQDAVSQTQHKINKVQMKHMERQAKIQAKVEKHRQNLEKKIGKYTSMSLAPSSRYSGSTADSRSQTTAGQSVAGDREAEGLHPGEDGFYDLSMTQTPQEIAPPPLSARFAARNPFCTVSRQTTSSQLTLESAVGSTSGTLSPQSTNDTMSLAQHLQPKSQKDKIFCVLPPADASGTRDPTWMRIHMENMDEVGAHTGLFFSKNPIEYRGPGQEWSERYSRFVCDVSEKIEMWVGEEMTRRLVEGFAEDVD